jgi:methenyltetrahydromethanopterin cyclohydrolase
MRPVPLANRATRQPGIRSPETDGPGRLSGSGGRMISVNQRAAKIVEQMVASAEELGVSVAILPCGARVVDLGVNAAGGLLAGKYAAAASLGGMGEVTFLPLYFGDASANPEARFWLPGVGVTVDRPEIGCMSSQYAGWAIRRGNFFAIGSGPARALAAVEPLFDQLDYRDSADVAVIILEGRDLPGDEVAEHVARKCRLDPTRVTMLVAPTACLAGSIQLSARVVATGMHKMLKLGFDVRRILHGYGTCPIAPVVPDEDLASAHSNDCVLYGGQAYYTVRADDAEIESLIGRIPSSASPDYGTPSHQLFRRYGDFYSVDPLLFCPSQVTINNLASGRTFRAGRPNPQVLRESLLGESAE